MSTPIEDTINGIAVKLAYPDYYDKVQFIEEYQRVRKTKLLETLNMADASAEQKIVELNDFDLDPPLDWTKFFKAPAGRLFAFTLALRHNHGAQADSLAKQIDFPDGRDTELLMKLWNLVFVPENQAGQAADAPADNRTYGDGNTQPAPPPGGMATYGKVGDEGPNPPVPPATAA